MELIGIVILTLALIPVVALTHGAFRVILSILFFIFFPGYCLLAALFPRKDDLDAFDRIALSIILSIALVPLIGLILNYTPLDITLYPIVISISSLILITSVIALYRRSLLPQDQKFEFLSTYKIKLPGWKHQVRLDKILTIALIFSVIGALGVLIYELASPKTQHEYSEFYILGSDELAESYPRSIVLGESVEVTPGIINKEHQDTVYHVIITINGERVQDIGPIDLSHKGKWESKVIITPYEAGMDQKIEFKLFKGEENEAYFILHLWLDVLEQQQ